MEVKSKKLKTRNLPQNEEPIDNISSKPYSFIILFLIMGIYMIFTKFYLFGILILALFLYNLFFIKNRIETEFYRDYVVFYNENDHEECYIVFYEDIRSWKYVPGRFDTDAIEVLFCDGKRVSFKSLSKGKMCKHFRDHAYKLEEKPAKKKKAEAHSK